MQVILYALSVCLVFGMILIPPLNGQFIPSAGAAQILEIQSGAVYKITNVASGKCVNVHLGQDYNYNNVYQYTDDGSVAQKIRVVYNSSNDTYKFEAVCSPTVKRVLDVKSRAAQARTCRFTTRAIRPPMSLKSSVSVKENTRSY